MKIAMLSTFFPFRGGIAQFGAMLHRALEKEGNDVSSFTFTTQYPNFLFPGKTQFVEKGDEVDSIDAPRVLSSINPITFKRTAKSIKNTHPDLFISQYWMTFFGPSFGSVHKKLRKSTKSISILHNVVPHEKRFFDKAANKYFLKHVDGFIVMSDSVEKDLLSIRPEAKYLKIDHPIYNHFGDKIDRLKARENLSIPQDKKVLLFFGFIREYKGLDILLEALVDLPEEYIVLIAGEVYGSFDKYQGIIDDNNLNERVIVCTDYIPDAEVTNYFSAADLCVLPYRTATQSGITAISHHFEVPILATDVGGLRGTIEGTNTGLIVDESSKEAIKLACESYFNNNMELEFVKSIKVLKEKNSWNNFAKAILEFSKTI